MILHAQKAQENVVPTIAFAREPVTELVPAIARTHPARKRRATMLARNNLSIKK